MCDFTWGDLFYCKLSSTSHLVVENSPFNVNYGRPTFEVKIELFVDIPGPPPHLVADTGSTSRLPEEGDVVGVSSEGADVPVDPGDGSMLVPHTVVTCSKQLSPESSEIHHQVF